MVIMDDLERDLRFLKSYVGTLMGIQMLEYYDKNFLSGSSERRNREQIELLNTSLKKIDEISKKLQLI